MRDLLKQREKSLKGSNGTMGEYLALRDDCVQALPEDDSLRKRVQALVIQKDIEARTKIEAKIGKKSLTVKYLEDLLVVCDKELDSVASRSTIKRVSDTLAGRCKSHREPLVDEVALAKEGKYTMKAIAKLKQKLILEVNPTDRLLGDLNEAESKREDSHRSKLIKRLTQLMKDPKAPKTSEFHEFVDACTEELDENDSLLHQAKSAQEARVLEERGLKKIHDMDELERGEREKLNDALPQKKKSSLLKKKKSNSATASRFASLKDMSILRETVGFVSGLRQDLNGAPPASIWYKLGILLVLGLYVTIVVYSTSLAFQVTSTEMVDFSKFTDFTSKFKFSRGNSGANAVANSGATAVAATKSSPAAAAPPPQAAADNDDETESGGDGGGDDDDD